MTRDVAFTAGDGSGTDLASSSDGTTDEGQARRTLVNVGASADEAGLPATVLDRRELDSVTSAPHSESSSLDQPSLFDPGPMSSSAQTTSALRLADGSLLIPARRSEQGDSETALGAMVRGLIRAAQAQPRTSVSAFTSGRDTMVVDLLGGWQLATVNKSVAALAQEQRARVRALKSAADNNLASAASYMGSKRRLLPFVVEGILQWSPNDAVFLDLMCGSGVVTSGLARCGPTYASDAMTFCRALAVVQSGGYDRARALRTLDKVNEAVNDVGRKLRERLAEALDAEYRIFNFGGSLSALADRYRELVGAFPTYPEGSIAAWDPVAEVLTRRSNLALGLDEPCLFTAYFANLFFGIRQAVEIDTLRGAIERLDDDLDRTWALGALVVTVSRIATTYAGHFAQPIAPQQMLSDEGRLLKALDRRRRSVRREFEARLLTLAAASEQISFRAEPLAGPWEAALDECSSVARERPVTVYVDAPYRREEYSRFYHVLETLAVYKYPTVSGKGKVPTKVGGHRFESEFFTRSAERKIQSLAKVLDSVLTSGHRCVWSYSNAGDVAPSDVLDALAVRPSAVATVTAPYSYKAQGGSPRGREVREYLIMLRP